MQPSETTAHSRPAAGGTPAASWAAIALPLLVVGAAFLGGATQRWSIALVLGCFSVLLLVRPPRFSLGPALNSLALLFLALAAAAFLPARWFDAPALARCPDERFRDPAGFHRQAQPWITLECMILLLAGLALDLLRRHPRCQPARHPARRPHFFRRDYRARRALSLPALPRNRAALLA